MNEESAPAAQAVPRSDGPASRAPSLLQVRTLWLAWYLPGLGPVHFPDLLLIPLLSLSLILALARMRVSFHAPVLAPSPGGPDVRCAPLVGGFEEA